MYCASLNVLFIHIPKNAGQTISNYFIGLDGRTWEDRFEYFMGHNTNAAIGPPQIAHFTLDEYYRAGLIPHYKLDAAIKFAVVRNPWGRLWAEYNFNWKGVCSWDDFFDVFPGKITDDYVTGRDALRHIKPQVDFLGPGIEVLRLETLDADFSAFCQRHGLPDNGFSNKINILNSGHYAGAYNAKQIEIVRDFYQKDIETLGYEFGE